MYDNNDIDGGFDMQPYDPNTVGTQSTGTDWGRAAAIGLCVTGAAACSVAVYKALFPSEEEQERAKSQQALIDLQVQKAQAAVRQAEAEATLAEREVKALTQERVTQMKGYNLKVAESQAVAAASAIKTKLEELQNVDETMALVQSLLSGDGAAALAAQQSAQKPEQPQLSKEEAAMRKAIEAYIAAMS